MLRAGAAVRYPSPAGIYPQSARFADRSRGAAIIGGDRERHPQPIDLV
jgi:hypothetical protein